MNIRLAKYLPKLYKLLSDVLVKGVINDPAGFFSQLSEKMAEEDQKIMSCDVFKSEMFASLQEGFRQGGKASSFEIIQLMHDWGFEPGDITMPVTVWYGDCDHHVPKVLSERVKEHVKETEFFVQKGQGHYMFYTHWARILDEILNYKIKVH
jgi:pimeloyl-ACP methyl ester carboxylesterase